mmetsp:Transcript_18652/g.20819  ORF Transcript_18652/g.20819 Transcript_18652/m.20819 type:complete len:102 (+) Transcript_18652:43-348(+)
MQSGVGHQVVFKGNYQDFMETIDTIIHNVNEENEGQVDASSAREEALKLAKEKKLEKSKQEFNYFRPAKYDPKEFQTEDRYGYYQDPTYYENPVAVGKGKY